MYEELIKRLREIHPEEFGNPWDFAFACQQAMNEAADAIEELAAFKEQITDGHMYCMKDGILYRATVNPPKGKSIKLPPIKFAEPPEESEPDKVHAPWVPECDCYKQQTSTQETVKTFSQPTYEQAPYWTNPSWKAPDITCTGTDIHLTKCTTEGE